MMNAFQLRFGNPLGLAPRQVMKLWRNFVLSRLLPLRSTAGGSSGKLAHISLSWLATGLVALAEGGQPAARPAGAWTLGTPLVTYWGGPGYESRPMTDADARQLAKGGFNWAWSHEPELDLLAKHKLRALLNDDLLRPDSLTDPARRQQLDALIERVKKHPAMYAYHVVDEPAAGAFPALGRLVAYLRERDPAHLAYVNLMPTYANNEQLGTKGDTETSYREYLRQFNDVVKPGLISYDHYHFSDGGDGDQYFLNLALVRRAALEAELPFLNIVQGCSWVKGMRAPSADELRFLVYTTLAYGGQGLSYFVYYYQPFYRPEAGMFTTPEGQPTDTYRAAQGLNAQFVAVASELQKVRSLGAYHVGMVPRGAQGLPTDLPFRLEPLPAPKEFKPPQPVQGLLVGVFGRPQKARAPKTTHTLVVNLDYKQSAKVSVRGPRSLEVFDPARNVWGQRSRQAELSLPPGGGLLVRMQTWGR